MRHGGKEAEWENGEERRRKATGEHDRFITVKGDALFAYTSKACYIENIVEIIIVVGKVIFKHTGCIHAYKST